MQIIAISGSLRKKSFNTALINNAIYLASNNCNIELATLENIPLYNGDEEEKYGVPEPVEKIKKKIKTADALLISTPEYNNSIPGVLKNALDWLTRPPADIPEVFGGKVVGLFGATIGNMGTLNAQTAWLPIFRTLSMRPWFGKKLFLSKAKEKFDDQGLLTDQHTKEKLQEYIAEFIQFIKNPSGL
ncbi:MAG: NADPH-dependent FMN reductase [Simkaniaceae bacterium]